MKIPLSLFGAFRPADWHEEVYTRHPPFTVENISGRVYAYPRDSETESALDKVSSSLGLKKERRGRVRYLVSRGHTIKALREFDWYVRRSWRNKDLAVLWALAYVGENGDWQDANIPLPYLSELAGLTDNECGEALQRLFHSKFDNGSTQSLNELGSDRRLIQQTLEKEVGQLPIWTEELVMSVMCAGPGGSVADIYEAVLAQGLSIGAVYKVAERLKTQGYVSPTKHYRVNERGPMREMLSADCENCFFGYSNPNVCLEDTFRQIEDLIERDFGKSPSLEGREALQSTAKSNPHASRTNRQVLTSLRLMQEIDRISKEESVSNVLRKIEERYGLNLPTSKSQD